MGYYGVSSWEYGNFWEILQESFPIVLDEIVCLEEFSNSDMKFCEFQTIHDCDHSEDIFLVCDSQGFYIMLSFACSVRKRSDLYNLFEIYSFSFSYRRRKNLKDLYASR